MVDFVNPGVLGELPLFKRVFQQPIEAGRDKCATAEAQQLGAQRSEEVRGLAHAAVLRGVIATCCAPRRELLWTIFIILLCLHRRWASQLSRCTSQFILRRTQDLLRAHLPPKGRSPKCCIRAPERQDGRSIGHTEWANTAARANDSDI